MSESPLSQLPQVDRLLGQPPLPALIAAHGRPLVTAAARQVLAALREELRGAAEPRVADLAEIVARVQQAVGERLQPSLGPAINAAGVVLHTSLGRAVLAAEALEAVQEVGRGYCNLAVNLDTGRRGSRDGHVSELLCALTGAEAAMVVNNNAAATMLILSTLAAGREAIISRGQLVEIGGSFRMPEVMALSGAIMREVGATNKTHLRDYEAALSEQTGVIVRVHQSNYRIVGFSHEPALEELVALGKAHGVPVVDDLGSGALVSLGDYGLEQEPLVQDSMSAGAACACFSGDKLIGGPQSGLIVGQKAIIERLKKNPLARALRVDKLTLAALESTLRLFLNPETLAQRHPTYRMLSLSVESLQARAEKLAAGWRSCPAAEVEVITGETQVGSGSVPTQTLPTCLVALQPRSGSAEGLARRLRQASPAVFTRVQQGRVLLDLRTVAPAEDDTLAAVVAARLKEDLADD